MFIFTVCIIPLNHPHTFVTYLPYTQTFEIDATFTHVQDESSNGSSLNINKIITTINIENVTIHPSNHSSNTNPFTLKHCLLDDCYSDKVCFLSKIHNGF